MGTKRDLSYPALQIGHWALGGEEGRESWPVRCEHGPMCRNLGPLSLRQPETTSQVRAPARASCGVEIVRGHHLCSRFLRSAYCVCLTAVCVCRRLGPCRSIFPPSRLSNQCSPDRSLEESGRHLVRAGWHRKTGRGRNDQGY